MSYAKNYSFTLNNYSEEEYEQIIKEFKYNYLILGKEIGELKTPHIQGYIQLIKKQRITALKKINPRIHFEVSKGTPSQNRDYCIKENNYKEFGNIITKGSNTIQLYNQIIECEKWEEVLKIDGIERRLKYAQEVFKLKKPQKQENVTLRPIQQKIMQYLEKEPDDRTIYIVSDTKGGLGKTFLARYLVTNYDAFYCNPAKTNDILHLYNQEKIFIYDIPRCQEDEYINWGVIEKIKDGIYISGKYEGKKIVRKHNTHIIIFTNKDIPHNSFSEDRIKYLYRK